MMENQDKKGTIQKDIATSIITSLDRILILKRSDKVGTYKGRWACVSGYIEGEEASLETAYREISEEVGLGKEDVELIKEGNVLYARDDAILWAIHPFLFRAKRKEVKLDWEHVEYKWILPEDIERYETVPKLKETITSVL